MSDTRQQLVEAAIVVLNDDLSASLDKVAGQAGVTRRTLHRYFQDRQDLFEACRQNIYQSCQLATSAAYASSTDPRQQLEHLLYASIDCGTKYAFLYKLGPAPLRATDPPPADAPVQPLRQVLHTLHAQAAFSAGLTVAWLQLFFLGVVQATVQAQVAGTVARQELKPLAWRSFSQGIGLS